MNAQNRVGEGMIEICKSESVIVEYNSESIKVKADLEILWV